MKRKRFTEEQIIGILKEAEAGAKSADLCRRHAISEQTFYRWKAKYAGLEVNEARRVTDAVDGFLAGHRVLICDRDGKWTDAFRSLLEGVGVRIVLTPVQAPNANAYAERFVRSIREECLDHLIPFGERRLLHMLKEFVVHYHEERNHQGLDNDLIAPASRAIGSARVRCRDRLGGLLRYYYQAA